MYTLSFVRLACAALSIVALGALGRCASAQNAYYTTGTSTIDAAHSVNGNAFAGYDGNSGTDSQGHPYNPTVNLVSGGSVGGYLYAYNSSTVNVSGGSVGNDLVAFSSSTVSVSGGSSNGLFAYDNSTVSVSGGTFGQSNGINFYDRTTGAFTLIGSNLTAVSLGADTNFSGTDYALFGTLQSGTNLSGYKINVQSGARMFTLQNTPAAVPEPGSIALLIGLAVTGAGFAGKRRARK